MSDPQNISGKGLALLPCTITDAKAYVNRVHRHHKAPQGAQFAIAATQAGRIVGVVMVGRPVARRSCDGWTVEVTRLASDGTRNVCSFLYGAAWRSARERGYRRMITYTLKSEDGASLRAAGWQLVGDTPGRSWSVPSRPRTDKHPTVPKWRWEVVTSNYDPNEPVPLFNDAELTELSA